MRELKFRAWGINIKEYLKDADGNTNCVYILGDLLKQGNWVFEQYTGIKDKNGKEIYEGDIVEYVTYYYGNEKRHRKVIEWEEWDSDDFGEPHNIGYFNLSEYVEVIGNIHENKELLK